MPPAFFVPMVMPEKQAECYVEFARMIGRVVPAPGSRVYSITFSHNGERWTATVGEQLRGSVTKTSRVRGQKIERTVALSNGSTVMAIYPGVPFHVWHDYASRAWANPFLTGEPTSITYFAV